MIFSENRFTLFRIMLLPRLRVGARRLEIVSDLHQGKLATQVDVKGCPARA
jgi:hypothetical protein